MRITVNQVSTTPDEVARKSHARVLRRLQEVGQNTIADKIAVSESTMSRLVNENLERTCQLLAHAGFKVVRSDRAVMKKHMLEAMLTILYSVIEDSGTVAKIALDED